jgi:hypothetical protein
MELALVSDTRPSDSSWKKYNSEMMGAGKRPDF